MEDTAATIAWLLEGDVSIQYQVYRDLLGVEREDLRKRTKDLRWKLAARYPEQVHFEMEKAGKPSRWNTLRELRVIAQFDGSIRTS